MLISLIMRVLKLSPDILFILRIYCNSNSVCLPTHLQPFVGPWPLLSFLFLYTVGRTPWTGDQSLSWPLHTHRTNVHRHPFLTWYSSQWPQCSSWRRQFMPWTVRPLWSALSVYGSAKYSLSVVSCKYLQEILFRRNTIYFMFSVFRLMSLLYC
jgi:hypothetical protein